MAGTQCFHCHDLGSIPDWGTKILKASLCGPKKKKKCLLFVFIVGTTEAFDF